MDSVDNTAKRPEDMTLADIKATLAEATLLSKENEKWLKDLGARLDRIVEEREKAAEAEAKRAKERAEEEAKRAKERAEAEAKRAEAEAKRAKEYAEEEAKRAKEYAEAEAKRAKERAEAEAERDKKCAKEEEERKISYEKLHTLIFGVGSEVKGIAKSNNLMSEGYLYESLNTTKMMGGVHFDIVSEDIKGTLKRKDGTKVEGQYDVVMINDNAVCIVEVKYRLREDDVREIVDKHVNTFKELFPRYEGYKFYLAVGGMAIEKRAITTAKDLGVAIIRTKGGALEILDDNLKAY